MVERAHTGAEQVSDRRFWMKGETSKRLMFVSAESVASVIGPGAWILRNQSGFPFVTSDSPVVHAFLHRDELERMQFAPDVLDPKALRSDRAFFSYCALSPEHALISSPLLIPPNDSIYRDTNAPLQVLMLNELVRHHAQAVLISSRSDPYGTLAPMLVELDREAARRRGEASRFGAQIYTDTERCWIPYSEAKFEDGDDPLKTRLRLRVTEASSLDELRTLGPITEITLFENGTPVAGLRGGKVTLVPSGIDDDVVLDFDAHTAG